MALLKDLSINGKGNYGIGASAVEKSDDLYTYLRITDIRDDVSVRRKEPLRVHRKQPILVH